MKSERPKADRSRLRKVRLVWALRIGVPVASFVFGVVAQQLLQDYLASRDANLIAQIATLCAVTALFILLAFSVGSQNEDLNGLERAIEAETVKIANVLDRMELASGLTVEYVPDNGVGASYSRAADVIRTARTSLTFVDLFEPFENYQQGASSNPVEDGTRAAREEYYDAIITMIEQHKNDTSPFHRRVVQVSKESLTRSVAFHVDPPFQAYLLHVAKVQASHPLSCRVRIASPLIRTHFIIVDQRWIIMPVLSQDGDTNRQSRYGALFFEDSAGSLYASLRQMYQMIEAKSHPLSENEVSTDARPLAARDSAGPESEITDG